ncbi:hypothetical protein HGRIS_006449 [Hohenbuehelia grisea]|uniref:DUF6699 domain-containing protein n=1 Tax=Hohenbuehelia grisea TaxID=104357 RepID=A0ABR3K2E6_9AGAR
MGLFKRWGTPSTPKLASVSLPDDNDLPIRTKTPSVLRQSEKISPISSFAKKHTESRSSSPLPGFFRQRRESTSSGKPLKISTAYEVTCAVTLPSRPDLPSTKRSSSTSTRSSGGQSSTLGSAPPLAGPSNSMSWGGPSVAKPILKTAKTSPPHPGGSSTDTQAFAFPGSAPEYSSYRPHLAAKYSSEEALSFPRKRHHSTTGHAYSHVTPLPPKRVDTPMTATFTNVKKVPTKLEAISLSWPLVEYNSKRRCPLLYFDVAFDPIILSNVRAKKPWEGAFLNLTQTERETAACTHDTITDMAIVYPKFPYWPIHVHRAEGIRCIDVFEGLYTMFHTRLTKDEKAHVPLEYLQACQPAWDQRCKDAPCLTDYERRQGMRRVDLLKGTRIFSGLTRTKEGTWELHLAHPAR